MYSVNTEVDLQLEFKPPEMFVCSLKVLSHCLEEFLPEPAIEELQDRIAAFPPPSGDLILCSKTGLLVLENIACACVASEEEVLSNEAHQLLLLHFEITHSVILLVQARLLGFLDCFCVLFDVAHVRCLRLR